jgi:hypothetical protein
MDRFEKLPQQSLMSLCTYLVRTLLTAVTFILPIGALAPAMVAEAQPARVKIEYVAPKDPKHQALYELLKERRVLERLQGLYS